MLSLPGWLMAGGPLGLFGIAFLDSSFLSLFEVTDFLVISWAVASPADAWLAVLMLSLGSACGCSVLWWVGRRGGQRLLEKRFRPERIETMRAAFERWEWLALSLPAILPPPAPFKALVLAAGVFGVDFRRFLLAVGGGRTARYALWAAVGLAYGREATQFLRGADLWFRTHLLAIGEVSLFVLVALLATSYMRRRARPAEPQAS